MDQIVMVISDILLGAGAIGAAAYCGVLAHRLKRFNNLENGVGGAVALLSAQVDDMTRTLDLARKAAGHSSETLTALTERAEAASRKLELMLAALNDLPENPSETVAPAVKTPAPKPPSKAHPDPGAARASDPDKEAAQDAAWVAAASDLPRDDAEQAPLFLSRRNRVGGVAQ